MAAHRVSFEEALSVSPEGDLDVVALDDALQAPAAAEVRKSQVVGMRFIGGLSVEETAEALDVSHRDARLEHGEGVAAP